jgi:hypothetical protein
MIIDFPKDHLKWDYYINNNLRATNLSQEVREDAHQALNYLKDVLGDEFVSNCYNNHQIAFLNFENTAPWASDWKIWFSKSLKRISSLKGFDQYLVNLIKAKNLNESIYLLGWIDRFINIHFEVEIEPKVNIGNYIKKPDLLIIDSNNNLNIYIEITSIGESDISKKSFETMMAIFSSLIFSLPNLYFSGRIYKVLSRRHREEIITVIKGKLNELNKNPIIYEEKDVIELGIANKDNLNQLNNWIQEKKLKLNTLLDPPMRVDEIVRTRMRIIEKTNQLPTNEIGIIVVYNNLLFQNYMNLELIVNELDETIYDYPNIYGLILVGKWVGEHDIPHVKKSQNYIHIITTQFALFAESTLIMKNKYCNYITNSAIEQQIIKAITRGQIKE